MKVDVIQADDIKFGRFSWWSNWIDVAVFDHSYKCYLVQMKVSRTNQKKFKAINISPSLWNSGPRANDIGDLTQMKGANG